MTAHAPTVCGILRSLWLALSLGCLAFGTATAQTSTEYSAGIATNAVPQSIAQGADGNMWFTEGGVNSIARITPTGVVTHYPLPTANASPRRIVSGPDGNLWFTEINIGRIGRLVPGTGAVTEFAAGVARPFALTFGPDGALWYTNDSSGAAIGRMDMGSFAVTTFTAGISPGGAFGPGLASITSGPDGNLWFTESVTNLVGRLVPGTGTVTEFAAGSTSPQSIVAGPDGNLWFTGQSNAQIGRITPTGTVTLFGAGSANNSPREIISATDGKLYFTTMVIVPPATAMLSRITTAGVVTEHALTTDASTAYAFASGLAEGPGGRIWYTRESSEPYSGVGVFDPTQVVVPPTPVPTLSEAALVALSLALVGLAWQRRREPARR